MSVIAFIKKLTPNFERSRILEDIGQQKEYLNDTLIPNLKNAAKLHAGQSMHSEWGKEFVGTFNYALPEYRSRGVFQGLAEYFVKISVALQQIENQVPDLFNADVTVETLTYQKATILKYLESSRFLAKYSSRALSMLLTAETAASLKKDEKSAFEAQFTKWEKDWIAAANQQYIDTLRALNKNPRDIISAVQQIPEITVSEGKEKVLNQTVGQQKLDPLRLGFLSPASSPIYTLRMYITEWQHENYKAGVEEARVLELKVLELKNALEGKEDARTEKALEYTKGRLDKLNAKLQDYEEQGS